MHAFDGSGMPNRFDRELLFPLPNLKARDTILDIHTRKWAEPPCQALRSELAALCVGYCGADLKVNRNFTVQTMPCRHALLHAAA